MDLCEQKNNNDNLVLRILMVRTIRLMRPGAKGRAGGAFLGLTCEVPCCDFDYRGLKTFQLDAKKTPFLGLGD
jgi:hypothetical protein